MTRLPDVQARRVAVSPFSTLDADWASLCRRHWRSAAIAHWVRQEPVLAGCRRLADVIPPPGVDRTPVCRALARLSIAGDVLATRALLQLLVPGVVRLAARWRSVFGSLTEAGGEVVSRAALYIERLKEIDTTCNPAGYVLFSVNRDLIDAGRSAAARHEVPVLDPDERAPRSLGECELPAGHDGDHDGDPARLAGEALCVRARDLADDTERLSHRLGWIAPNLDRQQCGMSAIAAEDSEELRDAGALLERVAHQAARLADHVRVELGHDQPDMSNASGLAARCVPPPADPPLSADLRPTGLEAPDRLAARVRARPATWSPEQLARQPVPPSWRFRPPCSGHRARLERDRSRRRMPT